LEDKRRWTTYDPEYPHPLTKSKTTKNNIVQQSLTLNQGQTLNPPENLNDKKRNRWGGGEKGSPGQTEKNASSTTIPMKINKRKKKGENEKKRATAPNVCHRDRCRKKRGSKDRQKPKVTKSQKPREHLTSATKRKTKKQLQRTAKKWKRVLQSPPREKKGGTHDQKGVSGAGFSTHPST